METTTQLAIQRINTQRFIALDPTTIVLTPRTKQFVAGTRKLVDGLIRLPQTFKVIWAGYGNGFVSTIAGGETRRFDFILVGNFNAQVAINDHWKIGNQDNEIEYIYPFNGYEVKCGGTSHGGDPVA